jgi:hypothetical protein
MNYYVTWGIDIEADTPQEAARVARTIQLNPESAVARTEKADGLYKLFGDKRMKDVEALYAEAAASEPKDAMECLDVAAAKAEMED